MAAADEAGDALPAQGADFQRAGVSFDRRQRKPRQIGVRDADRRLEVRRDARQTGAEDDRGRNRADAALPQDGKSGVSM